MLVLGGVAVFSLFLDLCGGFGGGGGSEGFYHVGVVAGDGFLPECVDVPFGFVAGAAEAAWEQLCQFAAFWKRCVLQVSGDLIKVVSPVVVSMEATMMVSVRGV